jgi:Uncharacterized protein conserved in bacteria
MEMLFYLLVFVCGGFLAIQGPMNANLSANFGRHPVSTVSLTFALGSLGLVITALALQIPLPSWSAQTTSWWHWTGGLLGAAYVATISIAAPKIGIAVTMSYVLLGQVISSICLDHFGLVGVAEHATSWQRLAGVLLVFGGTLLVRRTTPIRAPNVEAPSVAMAAPAAPKA